MSVCNNIIHVTAVGVELLSASCLFYACLSCFFCASVPLSDFISICVLSGCLSVRKMD